MSEKISESHWLDLDAIKSERTTFRLTEEAMKNLEWLQDKAELTPKELFELMCSKLISGDATSKDSDLKHELKTFYADSKSDKRKTYVLSKGTIKKLAAMAEQLGISRNNLASNMINIFKAMVYEGLQKEAKIQDEIRELLLRVLLDTEVIQNKLSALEGKDPLYSELNELFIQMSKVSKQIEARKDLG